MGIDLYILKRGETMEEFERRESAQHFGGNNSTMAALEDLAKRGGVDSIAGYGGEEVVSPEVAAENARKIRTLLPTLEPGPPGSLKPTKGSSSCWPLTPHSASKQPSKAVSPLPELDPGDLLAFSSSKAATPDRLRMGQRPDTHFA